jgi:hypothetical protein
MGMLLLSFPMVPAGKAGRSRSAVASARSTAPSCAACAEAGSQTTIYAPIIELAESSGTEINLNCRSPHSLEVTPTFYTKKGEAFTGNIFEMGPAEVKTVDLKTLMPQNLRNRHDWGSMTLSHNGLLMEMWGQLRLLRVGGGNSTDVTFINTVDKRSDVRDAVWPMPARGSATIAIGNVAAHAVKAKLQFSNGDSQEVEIPSFGTELVRTHEGRRSRSEAEAVRITAADGSGDLIPAGAVTANDYASSIRFYDTKNVAQQNLYATNFRLHHVSPKLVLRNTGTQSLIATPRFRPAQGDPKDFIDLEAISLGPDEIKSIDLQSISAGTQGRADFDNVSIEVMNSGTKGSLIGALNGVDEKTGLTYDVPLRDSGGTRNLSGAYPWRLDGDVSTIVSITNATPAEAQFVVQINYPGGPYLLDPRKLPGGDTATFDLRKIRDQQIPDRNGHTIPKSVEGGQFRWFIHSGGHLIGRAEMLSYSCGNPCPPHYNYGYTTPEPTEVPEGDSAPQDVLEMDLDSYSNEYGPYSASVVSEWSWDTSVATVDFGSVTGISGGSTGTTATVEYPLYVNWDGDCWAYGTNQTNVSGSVDVAPSVYISNVTASGMSSQANGSSTVTVQVAANSDVPGSVTVTIRLLLESKTPTTIVPTAASGSQIATGISVSAGSPGSTTFTVGTDPTNATSGDMVFRASITALSNGGVLPASSPAGATDHVTVHVP